MHKHRIVSVVLSVAVLLLVGLPPSQAEGSDESGAELARQFLDAHPGGVLVSENHVALPDGSGFVGVQAGSFALSQCTASKFCMWSSANYSGSFTYVSGSGTTKTLTATVKSFWNNRSQAARLYNNAGTSSMCYSAGAQVASVAAAYQTPAKVYLSSGPTC